MSKLFTFLENFDITNLIQIYDENNNKIYEGEMGNVPQKITNMTSVISGSAKWNGEYLYVKVKRS